MKLTTLLLTVACLQAHAAAFSQHINISVENAPLEQVIKEIRRQSGYAFLYDISWLERARQVSLHVKKASIEETLNQCFAEQPFTYEIVERTIVIKPRFDKNLIITPARAETLRGIVTDTTNSPLPGVLVQIKGTQRGTSTDINGRYELSNVPSDALLVFTLLGYQTAEVSVDGRTQINIQLKLDVAALNEVIVVGYGTQKKESITGAISSVKGEQLTVAPIASVTNTLAGRLPGLVSKQSSGQPGFDAAELSIRGFGGALVIVDGVEAQDFNAIDPNQIESISILKDGSASIYGSRAGNGVILVTTKRGIDGKPTITLNNSYTMQGITAMPTPVSGGQFAELSRESYLQSGQPEENAPFTPEQIQKYYDGTDPQFPSTDWYDVLIRDWAPQRKHNISVRGGSDRVKYYGFLGYLNQETIWRKSGGGYKRYNLLSNVDAKISENFSLQLNLASTVKSRIYPPRLATGSRVLYRGWEDFWSTQPIYPASFPDPEKNSFAEGGGTGGAHMTTNREISGYTKTADQRLKGTIALNYSSKAIEGLSAKILANYSKEYVTSTTFEKPYNYYTYDYAADTYSLKGALGSNATMNITDNKNRVITGQFSLNYDKTFANDHHIRILALYEAIDYSSNYLNARRENYLTDAIDQLYAGSLVGASNNGSASEMGRTSYVGRLNYAYKNKYLLESSIRADASAKFSPENRWGYFPSISLGWRISEEHFLNSPIIDELKLRVSYGSAGNDGVGNFQYLTGYQLASNHLTGISYLFGNGTQPVVVSTGLANPDLTWEAIKIYDIGIDFSLWNRKLYGTADVFYRERNGIPATSITTLPPTFGAELPPENLNSINNRGVEFQLGTAGTSGNLSWNISANISWSRAKWGHYEEPDYTDPDQARIEKRSGRWTDINYGYLSDGLFTSQEEIDALDFNQDNDFNNPNSSLRPGDVRYKDVNGDGILDWKDQVDIGKGTTPHWMTGLNMNLRYKNFDISALFQGAMGYYTDLQLFPGGVYTTAVFEERWTPTNNNAHALVPRLGGSGIRFSDYNFKKAGYIRLKALSIGCNIPERWIEKVKLSRLRVYVAGTNLLTFDKLKEYDIDPEAPSGLGGTYYPQQRTISFGLTVSL